MFTSKTDTFEFSSFSLKTLKSTLQKGKHYKKSPYRPHTTSKIRRKAKSVSRIKTA